MVDYKISNTLMNILINEYLENWTDTSLYILLIALFHVLTQAQ